MFNLILFWLCAGILIYIYIGYPLLLIPMALVWRPFRPGSKDATPSITILFSARDEAESLPAKFACLEKLDYPRDRLQILAASDGSTDQTAELLKSHPMIEATVFEQSVGKNLALNHIVPSARGEVLIFTDANTAIEPQALRACAAWFDNPEIGFVAGNVIYERPDREDRVRSGIGAYWRYEAWLRWAESRLGSVLVGAGGLFAISKSLWQPMPPDVANDFQLPALVAAAGKALVYEPRFQGSERAAGKLWDELRRTRRITARGVRGTLQLLPVFLKKPFRFWQLLSHKVLRWFTVLFLLGLFYSTYHLSIRDGRYSLFLWMQIIFYFVAAVGGIGHALGRKGRGWWLPHIVFQALAMQSAAFAGVVSGIILGAPSSWHKPKSAR